jgi:hypothetical protein
VAAAVVIARLEQLALGVGVGPVPEFSVLQPTLVGARWTRATSVFAGTHLNSLAFRLGRGKLEGPLESPSIGSVNNDGSSRTLASFSVLNADVSPSLHLLGSLQTRERAQGRVKLLNWGTLGPLPCLLGRISPLAVTFPPC